MKKLNIKGFSHVEALVVVVVLVAVGAIGYFAYNRFAGSNNKTAGAGRTFKIWHVNDTNGGYTQRFSGRVYRVLGRNASGSSAYAASVQNGTRFQTCAHIKFLSKGTNTYNIRLAGRTSYGGEAADNIKVRGREGATMPICVGSYVDMGPFLGGKKQSNPQVRASIQNIGKGTMAFDTLYLQKP
jgi:hypothetical protein